MKLFNFKSGLSVSDIMTTSKLEKLTDMSVNTLQGIGTFAIVQMGQLEEVGAKEQEQAPQPEQAPPQPQEPEHTPTHDNNYEQSM